MATEQGTENIKNFNHTIDRGNGKGRREEIGLIFFRTSKRLLLSREPF